MRILALSYTISPTLKDNQDSQDSRGAIDSVTTGKLQFQITETRQRGRPV